MISKIIFTTDDSHFLDFWPLQANHCLNYLKIQPVLFHITNEESDFFEDEFGLVKKVKKVEGINSGAQAAMSRMFFTKYFPDDLCFISDIDLLVRDIEYYNFYVESKDFLYIFDSDAYDLNRSECKDYLSLSHFPYSQQLYSYHANVATGKKFNEILDTDCSFSDYILRHKSIGKGDLFWGVDEFYFSECVNNYNGGVKKINRGYISSWICPRRVERYRFPVILEIEDEIEAQKRDGIYDFSKLESDNIIDINLPRPYYKYKEVIDKLLKNTNSMKDLILIASHTPDTQRVKYLRDLLNTINKDRYDVMISSHSPIPEDLIQESDYFIFQKRNTLLTDFDHKFAYWFEN